MWAELGLVTMGTTCSALKRGRGLGETGGGRGPDDDIIEGLAEF